MSAKAKSADIEDYIYRQTKDLSKVEYAEILEYVIDGLEAKLEAVKDEIKRGE